MFVSLLACAACVFGLLTRPADSRATSRQARADEITFYTQPTGARVLRELPRGEAERFETLGVSGKPIPLATWADPSGRLPAQVEVFFELEGHWIAHRTIPAAELHTGVWPGPSEEVVRLEPSSAYQAVYWAVRGRPVLTLLAMTSLLLTAVFAWRTSLARRRGAALEALVVDAGSGLTGKVLGEFRLAEKIGSGGWGEVYRAVPDHSLDPAKSVAIKVLWPDRIDAESLQRVERELRLSSSLAHPNIVRVFEHGQLGRLTYIVMEYLPGRTLDALIPDHGLPATEALRYLEGVAQGLIHAHGQRVVHRDVKPENVMVSGDRVKLLDFGLAKREGHANLTATHAMLGTPAYIAPEQIRCTRDVDARADQYAFACLAYELLCGHPPHVSHDAIELLTHHQAKPAPLLGDQRPEYAGAVSSVLAKMLERDPSLRYPNLAQAFAELRAALESTKIEMVSTGVGLVQ